MKRMVWSTLSHDDHYSIKPNNPTIEASPSPQPVTLPYPSLSESSIDSSYQLVNPTTSPRSPPCLAIITQWHRPIHSTKPLFPPPPIIPSFLKKSYHQGYLEVATSQVWTIATPQSCHSTGGEAMSCNQNSDPLAQPPSCTTKHIEAQR